MALGDRLILMTVEIKKANGTQISQHSQIFNVKIGSFLIITSNNRCPIRLLEVSFFVGMSHMARLYWNKICCIGKIFNSNL